MSEPTDVLIRRSDAIAAINRYARQCDAVFIIEEIEDLRPPTEARRAVTDDMVDRALSAWREHLYFHTTGDENGDPVLKSTAPEAMRAALIAALAKATQ